MCSDTPTKPRRSVRELLDLDAPAPSGRWTLSMKLEFSTNIRTGTAVLDFFAPGGLFSGSTDMFINMAGDGVAQIPVDIEGEAAGESLDMDVYMNAPGFPHPGFFCQGTLVTEDRFEGRYTMPCADPEGCGCDGMEGAFSLVRTG